MNLRKYATVAIAALFLFALGACTSMDVKTTSSEDGTYKFTVLTDQQAWGMDSKTVLIEKCEQGGANCEHLSSAEGFQAGAATRFFGNAGTVAIGAGGYALGQKWRRPDQSNTSINQTGGGATANGGDSTAYGGDATANGGRATVDVDSYTSSGSYSYSDSDSRATSGDGGHGKKGWFR